MCQSTLKLKKKTKKNKVNIILGDKLMTELS